jgi:chloramphenicol O-acetyltransferase
LDTCELNLARQKPDNPGLKRPLIVVSLRITSARVRRRFFRSADRHHALATVFHVTSTRKEQEEINMKNQPKKTLNEDYGLFIVTVRIAKGKLIEELMSEEQKQATGLNKLTDQELANLNSWLDPDKVLAADPAPD